MPGKICPICGYDKVTTDNGMVRHQGTNQYCLSVQRDKRMAQKAKTEGKPSASPRTQRAAKRRSYLDEAEDGIGFKKE